MTMVALEGLRPWLLQRLTALYMVVYTIYAVVYWTVVSTLSYSNWQRWLADEFNMVLLGLFYLSLLIHAWVGIRDVLLDYIKPLLLRLILLFLVAGSLMGAAIWMMKILLSVNV